MMIDEKCPDCGRPKPPTPYHACECGRCEGCYSATDTEGAMMEYPTPDMVNCEQCGARMASYPDDPCHTCSDCNEKARRKDGRAEALREQVKALKAENKALKAAAKESE